MTLEQAKLVAEIKRDVIRIVTAVDENFLFIETPDTSTVIKRKHSIPCLSTFCLYGIPHRDELAPILAHNAELEKYKHMGIVIDVITYHTLPSHVNEMETIFMCIYEPDPPVDDPYLYGPEYRSYEDDPFERPTEPIEEDSDDRSTEGDQG